MKFSDPEKGSAIMSSDHQTSQGHGMSVIYDGLASCPSNRDLNPCSNHNDVFAIFSGGLSGLSI